MHGVASWSPLLPQHLHPHHQYFGAMISGQLPCTQKKKLCALVITDCIIMIRLRNNLTDRCTPEDFQTKYEPANMARLQALPGACPVHWERYIPFFTSCFIENRRHVLHWRSSVIVFNSSVLPLFLYLPVRVVTIIQSDVAYALAALA